MASSRSVARPTRSRRRASEEDPLIGKVDASPPIQSRCYLSAARLLAARLERAPESVVASPNIYTGCYM